MAVSYDATTAIKEFFQWWFWAFKNRAVLQASPLREERQRASSWAFATAGCSDALNQVPIDANRINTTALN
jgi:hypothetical protein